MMEWDKRTKDHPNAINKNLSKREDDWWVESGGPPVTNNGEITTNKVHCCDILFYTNSDSGFRLLWLWIFIDIGKLSFQIKTLTYY